MGKTDKKIFATGDLDQLQPFGFQLNNVQDKKQYLKRIFDMMFPNQIILEHNKRLKTEHKHMFPMLPFFLERYIFLFDPTYRSMFDTVIQQIPAHIQCYYYYRTPEHVYRTVESTVTVSNNTNGTETAVATTDACLLCLSRAVSEDLVFIQQSTPFIFGHFTNYIGRLVDEIAEQLKQQSRRFQNIETLHVNIDVDETNTVRSCNVLHTVIEI